MSLLDDDLDAILADELFTELAVYGAQSCRGFLTTSDVQVVDEAGIGMQLRGTVFETQSGALTGLAEDAAITVGGRAFRIREWAEVDDRRVLRIVLAGG